MKIVKEFLVVLVVILPFFLTPLDSVNRFDHGFRQHRICHPIVWSQMPFSTSYHQTQMVSFLPYLPHQVEVEVFHSHYGILLVSLLWAFVVQFLVLLLFQVIHRLLALRFLFFDSLVSALDWLSNLVLAYSCDPVAQHIGRSSTLYSSSVVVLQF